MNVVMFDAFVDEMEKIALAVPGGSASVLSKGGDLLRKGGQRLGRAIKEGWEAGADVPGRGWLGSGYQAKPTDSMFSKAFEGVTSLGGTTKYLPVGPKAMTVGFTGMALPGAVSKEDPTGEGRSRAERVGSLAGGTVAGLASAKMGLVPAIAAGMGGDFVGGRAGRLLSRKPKRPVSVAAPPPPMPPDAQT